MYETHTHSIRHKILTKCMKINKLSNNQLLYSLIPSSFASDSGYFLYFLHKLQGAFFEHEEMVRSDWNASKNAPSVRLYTHLPTGAAHINQFWMLLSEACDIS